MRRKKLFGLTRTMDDEKGNASFTVVVSQHVDRSFMVLSPESQLIRQARKRPFASWNISAVVCS